MPEAVVLLHGMGRSWISMALLAVRLRRSGYETHLFGYSPRRESLDELSRRLQALIDNEVKAPAYSLIGHSLGNIIVRNGFRTGYRSGLKRVVMLSPPNGPAALASSMRHSRVYKWMTGDSGQKLGDESFYQKLPIPTVEFGVIAGDRGHRVGFNEPNDGVVRVENTKLEGMRDWVLVHHTHTFIMMSSDTFTLCLGFLRNGSFSGSPSSGSRSLADLSPSAAAKGGGGKAERLGFALLEVLLALSITLVIMLLVAQTMSHVRLVYEAQTELATSSSSATLALDDIAYELSLAGHGLGDGVASVLPRVPGARAGPSSLTVRSNPNITAGVFLSELEQPGEDVALAGADSFDKGDLALLTDARGRHEVAEVVRASETTMALRSLESADGSFRYRFSRDTGGRALGLREVRYFLREAEGDGVMELVKDVVGVGARVLSRDVVSLAFEYLDEHGEPIASGKVEDSDELSTVRIHVRFLPGANALAPLSFVTAVALTPGSGTVDFESRYAGFRLSRYFHPIDSPAGVASRVGADWGVILAAGANPHRDSAYAYAFLMESRFNEARVDDIALFEDVRAPVTLTFGPERGPLAGSLFVAAWGLRIGHLLRVAPDAGGGISKDSEVTIFEGTEAMAQAGGMTFAVDDALYVTSREKGAIYRYQFDPQGKPGRPEHVFRLAGTPAAIVEGTDGYLYFLLERAGSGSLWKMAFDETLSPVEPELVGPLPGVGLSLTRDPIDGNLFALVRSKIGDFMVVELSRAWIETAMSSVGMPPEEPRVLFSLEAWQRKLEEGDVATTEIPFHPSELPVRMNVLRTEELDFVAFDALGSLYMGAKEANLVLNFELLRPSGRYAVGLAAGVVERGSGLAPEVRMHAWKKVGY